MSVDTSDGHAAMDYKQHERTYAGFITGIKISVAVLIVLLVGMALTLT